MEKLWFYGKKTMRLYRELRNFDLGRKNMADYQKIFNKFIALEFLFTMGKLWYYVKNYGIIPKTMEL